MKWNELHIFFLIHLLTVAGIQTEWANKANRWPWPTFLGPTYCANFPVFIFCLLIWTPSPNYQASSGRRWQIWTVRRRIVTSWSSRQQTWQDKWAVSRAPPRWPSWSQTLTTTRRASPRVSATLPLPPSLFNFTQWGGGGEEGTEQWRKEKEWELKWTQKITFEILKIKWIWFAASAPKRGSPPPWEPLH